MFVYKISGGDCTEMCKYSDSQNNSTTWIDLRVKQISILCSKGTKSNHRWNEWLSAMRMCATKFMYEACHTVTQIQQWNQKWCKKSIWEIKSPFDLYNIGIIV